MTDTVAIGKTDAGRLFRIPEEVVSSTFGIVGMRGSGKTVSSKTITEGLLDHDFPVVILDPLDVWWGLRSSSSGKQAGYEIVIIGGEHSDVPLEASSGKAVADFITESSFPSILSLRHLSGKEQRRVVSDFCEQLYGRRGESKYRTPLHVVIDEADEYAPQRLYADAQRCFGAVDKLVRRGRAFGLGVTLITQRPQAINKDVLSQVAGLVMHRVVSPQDRKALEAWIERHDAEGVANEVLSTLHKLDVGEAWVWTPGVEWLTTLKRVRIKMCATFDSSASPKLRKRAKVPTRAAQINLKKLSAEMKAAVEKAEAEDPIKLHARIRKLEADLSKRPDKLEVVAKPVEKIVEVPVPVLDKDDVKLLEGIGASVEGLGVLVKPLSRIASKVRTALGSGRSTKLVQQRAVKRPLKSLQPSVKPKPQRSSPQRLLKQTDVDATVALSKCQRAILTVLAQIGTCNIKRLATMAGYSVSGSFETNLSGLRTAGYAGGGRQAISITDDGLNALGDYVPLPEGDALFDYWKGHGQVNKCCGEILDVLFEAHPETMVIDTLAAQCHSGYSASGSFQTNLSRLRTLGLVEGGRAAIKLSQSFTEGLGL